MSNSLVPPISAKLRLCQPSSATLTLAQHLAASGASYIVLHARHPSSRRRRHGSAELSEVRRLKEGGLGIPVVSNGNVKVWSDLDANREETRADGVMVGETLLGNPW